MGSKIKGGFYIKARCIRDSEIAHCSPAVREIWDYLLREANHKPEKVKGTTIGRGQLIRSLSDIREALSWNVGYRKETYSEDTTKKAMKTLRERTMILTTKALGGILITICKYEYYQNISNYEGTNTKLYEGTNESTNEGTNGGTSIEQELINNNKKEKYKKEKSLFEPDNSGEPEQESTEQMFEKIWALWPEKVSRKKAYETFRKIFEKKGGAPDFEKLLAGIDRYRKYLSDHPTIQCAHLSTWLNGQRWNDEYGVTLKLISTNQPKEQTFSPKKFSKADFE